MNDNSTDTIDILRKAADIIDTRGWCQGGYLPHGSKGDDGACSVDLLGAISVAFGLPADMGQYGKRDDTPQYAAAARFAQFVDFKLEPVFLGSGWNDALGRTAEDVTTALRSCAAELAGAAK